MDFYPAAGILQRFSEPLFRLRLQRLAAAIRLTGEHNQLTQQRAFKAALCKSLLLAVPEVVFNG
jgi:hypothetical protein